MKSFLFLSRVFGVGTDQTGQHLDIGPDMRHEPLIMQREHQDTESTTRETTRQVGVRRKKEFDSEGRRCNTIQICVYDTVIFGPRQIRILQKAQSIWPRESVKSTIPL